MRKDRVSSMMIFAALTIRNKMHIQLDLDLPLGLKIEKAVLLFLGKNSSLG